MSARHRLTSTTTAMVAALLIALSVLPAVAGARPAGEGLGPRGADYAKPSASTPAPTVVRTVVKEEAVRVLPIALAGAALLIAIAGTGYALVRVPAMRPQLRGEH
jgi:hypothetical protein